MMKTISKYIGFISVLMLLFTACRPDDLAWNLSDQRKPIVQTQWYELTDNNARISCMLRRNGGLPLTSLGVVYSTQPEPMGEDGIAWANPNIGEGFLFFVGLEDLEPGQQYFARAFAENALGVAYGQEISFSTAAVPQISTTQPGAITDISFFSGGFDIDDLGFAISEMGLMWSASVPFDPNTSNQILVEEEGDFTVTIDGLEPGSTYFVRAFARNWQGLGLGNVFELTTLDSPILETFEVVQNSPGSVVFNGEFTGEGLVMEQLGFVYSSTPNPIVGEDEVITVATTQGAFSSSLINGLVEGNIYYVRSFVRLNGYDYYANEMSFAIEASTPSVGVYFGGGIVAYLFQEGDEGYVPGELHGITILPFDLTSPGGGLVSWGCSNQLYGAQGIEIGQGGQNTMNVVGSCTNIGTAAYLCANLTYGGYSDWFLPSIGELVVIRGALYDDPIRDFTSDVYWSSTEVNISIASAFNFVAGSAVQTDKVAQRSVFAARYF